MESQGCGIQVVMNAKLALEMGAPIRGIVAFTSTSTYVLRVCTLRIMKLTRHHLFRDKAGRSVPAPGQGVVSIAREAPEMQPSPMIDIAYRSRQMAFRRKQISQWISNEHEMLREEVAMRQERGEKIEPSYVGSRETDIEQEAVRQEKAAQATYGMLQGTDSRVAPLRRALAVWGLTADDLGMFHP